MCQQSLISPLDSCTALLSPGKLRVRPLVLPQQHKNRIIPNSHFILELTSQCPGLWLVFVCTYIISFQILCAGLVGSVNLQTLVMIPGNLGSLTWSGFSRLSSYSTAGSATKSIRQKHTNLKGFKTLFASCKWGWHSRPPEVLGVPKTPMLETGTW